MNLPQNHWTIDQLASLPDDQLDRLGKRAAGHLAMSRLTIGRVMLAMERTGLPARLGLSGALHYFILQGVHKAEANECRRVARQSEPLPKIREAAETGALGWTYLREIVRVASVETEEIWLELCQRHSTKQVQQLVKHTVPGDDPLNPQGDRPARDAVEVELRLTLPAEINALLARVTRELSVRAGRPLSPRATLECLLAQHLTGHAFPGEVSWNKLTEQARRDLSAHREAELREVEQVRETENSREFSEKAPWAAVAASEAPFPGEPDLLLVRRAAPHWENDRLRFNEETRHLTGPQRRELLRRDAYHCASPDCPHHVWLHVHHLVYHCRGGVTVPDNLVVLCSTCHGLVHKGLLRVERRPDGSLSWWDGEGRSLTNREPEARPVEESSPDATCS